VSRHWRGEVWRGHNPPVLPRAVMVEFSLGRF
jgi:hypothetical protein